MPRKIFDVVELLYMGRLHRFLEFESDDPAEFDEFYRRSIEKGWSEYTRGTRAGASQLRVIVMVKAA